MESVWHGSFREMLRVFCASSRRPSPVPERLVQTPPVQRVRGERRQPPLFTVALGDAAPRSSDHFPRATERGLKGAGKEVAAQIPSRANACTCAFIRPFPRDRRVGRKLRGCSMNLQMTPSGARQYSMMDDRGET